MRNNVQRLSIALLMCGMFVLHASADAVATPNAGVIGNYTDILCMDKTDTHVEMTVENIISADLGVNQQYAYLLSAVNEDGTESTVDTLEYNTESLSFLFSPSDYPTLPVPSTFHLYRIASPDGQTWLQSNGMCTFTVAKNEYTDSEVTHCINDLPVSGTYTYYDGRVETYIFRADTLERMFVDRTELGCVHEHTIRCVLTDVPQVEVDTLGNVCQTDDKMQITYRIISGAPNSCHVIFDETAKNAGFTDTDVELTDDNTITLSLPTSQMLQYDISLQFYDKNSTNGCESNVYSQKFTLNLSGFLQEKWDDVLFVDNNDKNCNPDCESDLRFKAYQWYKNDRLLEGETDQVYYEEGGLNGRYYVVMTDTAGNEYRSCEVERRPVIQSQQIAPLRIAPVPAYTGQTLSVSSAEAGTVRVTNMTGRTLLTTTKQADDTTIKAPAEAGVYIVSLSSVTGRKESIKLIVK